MHYAQYYMLTPGPWVGRSEATLTLVATHAHQASPTTHLSRCIIEPKSPLIRNLRRIALRIALRIAPRKIL